MSSILNSIPTSVDLQRLWDIDPQSFALSPMPGFEGDMPWSATQWALATQPVSFWRNKMPPAEPSLWSWALAQAPASALANLAALNVPAESTTLAGLIERYRTDLELKKPKSLNIFQYAAQAPSAWSTATENQTFAAQGIVASQATPLLTLLNAEALAWVHPTSHDTLLHVAVQSEWKLGLRRLLEMGVSDARNTRQATAQDEALSQGWAWPTVASGPRPSRTSSPRSSSGSTSQMDLF